MKTDSSPSVDYRKVKASALQALAAAGDVAALQELERRGLPLEPARPASPPAPRPRRRCAPSAYLTGQSARRPFPTEPRINVREIYDARNTPTKGDRT